MEAVTLGGSRATETHRADSDWDFAIYYQGRFDPADLRATGWPGEVSEIGGWGGGVAAELAGNKVLSGSLPRPDYPPALRERAPPAWWSRARLTLSYARDAHAPRGHAVDCAGAAARACCETAHAILAARGEWITNEKRLLQRAGLRGLDPLIQAMTPSPAPLTSALEQITDALHSAAAAAGVTRTSP